MASLAVVPAAGRSERFGSAKLLAPLNGEPLLNWTLWSLIDGGVQRVVVVVSRDADFSSVRLMTDARVTVAINEDPSRGMFSSIQAGLQVASGDPLLFLPADMPFVTSSTVRDVLTACIRRQRVIMPTHEGRRGHPLAVPGALRRALLLAPVEATLKTALGAAVALGEELAVGDPGILRDVDLPQDIESGPAG